MVRDGGREKDSSPVHQNSPAEVVQRGSSFSTLDDTDLEILSLTSSHPATLLKVCEKADISFVECLSRARRLQQKGLLKEVDGACGSAGMHLYVATQ